MHSSFLSLDQYSGEQGVQSAAPVRHEYKSVLSLDVTFIENKMIIVLVKHTMIN